MCELLPRVCDFLEATLAELLEERETLQFHCDAAKDLLSPAQSSCKVRRNSSPLQEETSCKINKPDSVVTIFTKRNTPIKKLPLNSDSSKYEIKVRSENAVYCFETLDDLLSRVVAPEDIYKKEDKCDFDTLKQESKIRNTINTNGVPEEMVSSIQAINKYIAWRKKSKDKIEMERNKFLEKLDKDFQETQEVILLFEHDLGTQLGNILSSIENEHDPNEHLKILENKYTKNWNKEDDDYDHHVQCGLTEALLSDLQGDGTSPPTQPSPLLYKTCSALSDIRHLKVPTLINKP